MITIMGLGFVGLTTALGFCEHGYTVFGYDADPKKMESMRKGRLPFHEPELASKLKQHTAEGKLCLVEDIREAIASSRFVFFCVGTPSKENGEVNLDYLEAAVASVLEAREKRDFLTLVIKSTVPPATIRDIVRPMVEHNGWQIGKDTGLAANPEFLREDSAWLDFLHPDRIVVGWEDERSALLLEELYRPFHAPVFLVSSETAEYIKYLSNTMLAAMISFANEQSLLAKRIGGIDIKTAFRILHQDKRWFGSPANMASYVYPGCGFGGYCLPKDTQALVAKLRGLDHSLPLLSSVLKVNAAVKEAAADEIAAHIGPEDTVGILGLSFKPNSDDVRQSPAKDIIELLINKGCTRIIAYDPLAMQSFQQTCQLPIQYSNTMEDCIKGSSTLVLLTAWSEFLEKRELFVHHKRVLDYRYIL